MTIAFAIVLSVVLAISAWLIEKRSAWKKAGKFFLYGLGVIVVVPLLGWGGYVAYEKIGEWNTRRLVSNGSIDTYLGVRLGMKEEEVRYRLGAPEEVKEDDGMLFFSYGFTDAREVRKLIVFLNGSVSGIVCIGSKFGCPELVGVRLKDTEEEVLSKLGATTEPATFADGLKRLEFGPPNGRVIVWLKKDAVTTIRLSDGR